MQNALPSSFALSSETVLLGAIIAYLLLANGLAWIAMGIEKRRAVSGEQRIPEVTLLILATLGGWPGAKIAQHYYRHKTRKQPFRTLLNGVGVLQLLVILGPLAMTSDRIVQIKSLAGQALAAVQPTSAPVEPEQKPLPRRFGPGSEKS